MADCTWTTSTGDSCKNWTPRDREYCDFHHNILLIVTETYYKIARWAESKYGGSL